MISDKLKKYINELIHLKLKEETGSTTGAGEAYNSKYFLSRRDADISTYTKDGFTKAPSKPLKHSKVFDVIAFKENIAEITEKKTINEISYRRFSENISKISPERKITRALHEVTKRLKEIEQVIEYSSRLKTENTIKKESFWTSKTEQLCTLSERLNELSNKIRLLYK